MFWWCVSVFRKIHYSWMPNLSDQLDLFWINIYLALNNWLVRFIKSPHLSGIPYFHTFCCFSICFILNTFEHYWYSNAMFSQHDEYPLLTWIGRERLEKSPPKGPDLTKMMFLINIVLIQKNTNIEYMNDIFDGA